MTCNLALGPIIEIARGQVVQPERVRAVQQHIQECGSCRARMALERHLSAGLRELRESAGAAEPSAAVEVHLLEALSAIAPPSREMSSPAPPPAARATWWSGLAAAALLAAVVSLLVWQRLELAGQPDVAEPVDGFSEFVPWPGAESLPRFESGQLVRMDLPTSVLPLLGIVPAAEVTTGTVPADVIVGQDGLARAVRVAWMDRLLESHDDNTREGRSFGERDGGGSRVTDH